jgi:hypothetical protein
MAAADRQAARDEDEWRTPMNSTPECDERRRVALRPAAEPFAIIGDRARLVNDEAARATLPPSAFEQFE